MRIREVTGVIAAKVGGSGPGGQPSEAVSPRETVSDNVRYVNNNLLILQGLRQVFASILQFTHLFAL
jgi:hypothetical protein